MEVRTAPLAHRARDSSVGVHHVRHHDGDGAGGVGGRHAVIGILDRDANFRLQAEARRRQQIEIGARLAARDVVAGQDGFETVADSGEPSDAQSAVRSDEEVTIAIGHSAACSASSNSTAPRFSGRPARENFIAIW